MPAPTPAAPPSPFATILSWSASWPEWQRDALRRIVGSGPLSPEALKELAAICRAKHGLLPATGTAPTAVPLASAHTPGGADGTASVSLSKLSGLHNVGRLPSDQEIIFGNAPGLTVIYGENGAGKSGYARVIKKACRARGTPQDIKPDAFAAAAAGPATAKIGCRVGAVDTPVDWTDGGTTDPRLGNIFVFDSFSARVHVGEDGPACFKPRGLDVLPELAKACDTLGTELKKEIDATFAENAKTAQGWKYSASTAVGKLINAVGAATKPETIDTAAVFTDADEKRLAEIIATLSTDPKIKAADTTAAAKRIRTLAETAKNRATSVDDTAMQGLGEAIKEAETTAKAANFAAGPELTDTDLPGSCNDVWRKLWDAAKAYSVADAYPGKIFPVTEPDAKCVLCQQTLQPDAIERYARFNKFVADETRKRADVAKAKVTGLKPGVDSLRAIGTDAAGIKADLDREAAGIFATVEAFAKAVDARIAHAQKCLKDGTWTDAPALPASPCANLLTLANTLDTRATSESATADPIKKKEAETERDELTDKKWLAGKRDEVKAQIARHAHAAKLKKCQDDCTTNAITIKSGELHETHVTEKFCKAFEEELAALGMKTLPVKLDAAKGAKGERRFGVKLNGTASAKVGDIASEGEHRCIALAAFMAELSQASHKSALVFDDPVSSLDHKRREEIAKRLVREAEIRQVIVFTHDLAFLCDLEDATSGGRKAIHCQHIEWRAGKPGSVASGLIWDAMSTDQQLKDLRERIGRADKVKREGTDSEYKSAVSPIVDDMRSACERIIEDVLLGDLLKRHSSQIKVGHVDRVAKVRAEDWLAIKRIWSECSDATPAHANTKSGPHKVPEPATLNEWMKALDSTVEVVRNARKPGGGMPITEPKPAGSPAPHH
ncbi:MAG: AAA family ATPase [Phycisphaerales bacterium]|jgi:energy-coupling factor transporter ATP-binding protein EcfA2